MLGIFGADPFEQRPGLGGLLLAQQALAEVRTGVDVLRFAFERGAVTGFGLVEFALLEVDVAKLRMMMRLVEMMDLRLEFLDAATVMRAGQFKAARGRRRAAKDVEEIPERCAASRRA